MKNFTSFYDVESITELLQEALMLKENPLQFNTLGKKKTLGLVFLNASLRTRLSTQKAAMNLGLHVIVLNVNQESWAWEFEEGAVMNGTKVEHIKDAAAILSMYCDMVGIRCFPSLENREDDYNEKVLNQFIKYCSVPVISLESAIRHPLQSFADLITITENWKKDYKPKVVLTWAPHIKPLPQAVANSFSEWMCNAPVDFVITHPHGYELKEEFTQGAKICYEQTDALQNADFVYVKNWSSYNEYGKMPETNDDWLLNEQKLAVSNDAKIMHCLPVRRNVELTDELLDGKNSLVLQQAHNRLFAAQAVLKKIMESNFN
ncbi:MAG: N-acetylornithine carbamoyltransferase [Bacteroidota bacterium]